MENLRLEFGSRCEPWLVLGLGAAAIVALTALAARLARPAVWQRTLWQAATLGLLLLAVFEATGAGPAMVGLCRMQAGSPGIAPGTAASPIEAAGLSGTVGEASPLPAEDSSVWADGFASVGDDAEDAPAVVKSSFAARRPQDVGWVDGHRRAALVGEPHRSSGEFSWWGSATNADQRRPTPTNAARRCPVGARSVPGRCPSTHLAKIHDPAPPAALRQTRPGQFSAGPGWPGAIWLLGTLVVAVRAGWGRLLLARFRRCCRPVCDAGVLGCVDRLAGQLGLRRPIRVLEAEGLLTPAVFGSLRPALAVPARFQTDFDPGQQEAVLAHEMAHLAAGDPAWQFLAGLGCALLWWQPLVWWSRRRLRAASEAVADEASLLVPDGPGLLAASLVAVGRRLLRSRRLGWISIEGDGFRSGLGRRVERLMELRSLGCGPGRVSGHGRGVFVKTLLTVAAALVAISCTAWAQPQAPSLEEGGTTMSVLKTSWRCSFAAALWALAGPTNGTAADNPPTPPEKPTVERSERPAAQPGAERTGTRRDDSRATSDEVQKQRQRIMEEIRALRAKAEGLKDGSDADRKELRAKMQKLYEQLQALPGGPRPGGPGRAEGREGGARPGAPERAGGRGDLRNQVDHLRAAADNLRAAGMSNEADMILKRIERLQAEASQGGPPREGARSEREPRGGPSREAGPPREGVRSAREAPGGIPRGNVDPLTGRPGREAPGPSRPEGPPPILREIAELHGQVEQMRHEMQELREQIDRFMRQSGDRRPAERPSGDRRPERAPPPSPSDSGRR